MTNFTKAEIHKAYKIVCNKYDIAMGRKLKVDKRTRVGNLAIYLSCRVNKKEIYEKQYNRRYNNYSYSNILDSSLYYDFKNNRHDIKFITPERIAFIGNRNHWAKSERDSKILNILSKHINK